MNGDNALRIAFLNTHPIQYNTPLYAYLNKFSDLDVTALYMSDFSIRGSIDSGFRTQVKWDIDLLHGYQPVFMGEAASKREMRGFFSMFAPQLWSEVRSGRYDALVIHGHNFAGHHVALAAARSIGLPVFMRCETHLGLHRAKLKSVLREPLLKSFYARFNGFFAIGTANSEFYRAMGVSEDKIFLVPYTVDNERFNRTSTLAPEERRKIRSLWGVVDDRPIVLFAAKFQKRKHPDDLLRACEHLVAEGLSFHLVLAGSGEMEEELRAMASTMSAPVSFVGFINQTELPKAYGASDVFVLPSTNEPWGLAINEAMAAGLPVVASREIGAVRDIVIDGVTGRVFNARDVAGLAEAIGYVIASPERQRNLAQASRDLIAHWSYEECLQGVRLALQSIRNRPTARHAV